MTPHAKTCRKVTLLKGVYPLIFKINTSNHPQINQAAITELENRGILKKGDHLILTKGDLTGVQGGTNAIKILRVGDKILLD
jgi:pyruvate kinase